VILSLIIIYWLLQVYLFFIGLNILLSWFPGVYEYKFFRVTNKISNWYLGPFHGGVVLGAFDFTPIIGLAIYQFALDRLVYLINLL
jgi:uncharacterized protein YggT (Ycf19 family)